MPEQPSSECRTQTRALKHEMMQDLLTGKTRLVSRGERGDGGKSMKDASKSPILRVSAPPREHAVRRHRCLNSPAPSAPRRNGTSSKG